MSTETNHQEVRDALGLLLDVRDAIHNRTMYEPGNLAWEFKCSQAWLAGYTALGRTLGGAPRTNEEQERTALRAFVRMVASNDHSALEIAEESRRLLRCMDGTE